MVNKDWRAVFDLDDTLYPAECGMWLEIQARINRYMVERLDIPEGEAPLQRSRYFLEHGTSLAGLRHDYPDMNADEYLEYVHDVPYQRYLSRDEKLASMLGEVKMAKSVFTNSDRAHALRVLSALGVEGHFDVIVDVYATNFINKPKAGAFYALFEELQAEPWECVLIDDQARNLEMARSLGMTTVLVGPEDCANVTADFCVTHIVQAGDVLQRLAAP